MKRNMPLQHVMFDIDGTLLESYDFDSNCYIEAIQEVTGIRVSSNWAQYAHVTDSGILREIITLNSLENACEIHKQVKKVFIKKIKQHIKYKPVREIQGAALFLVFLQSLDNVTVSLATGGWYESAALKLQSAGIDFAHIPMVTANDHHMRIEIMKMANKKATGKFNTPYTYFGDGIWDKQSCEQLGINFVLVGNKVEHNQTIENFQSVDKAMAYIGL